MKRLFITGLILLLNLVLFAQMERHSSWQYAVKKTGTNEAELILKASIDPGWHLYGQHFPDGGPIRMEFAFEISAAYDKIG